MDEIQKAIAAIRAQNGTDADVEAYLRSIGAQEVTTKPSQRRMDVGRAIREDVNRREAAALEAEPSFGEQWAQRTGGALSSGLSMLPGGKAYQALVRGAVRQQPFSEALADINLAQGEAPAVAKSPAQAAGIVASLPLAPARAGGAAIGAGFGGATRALSTEHPDESLWDRIKGTAGAAAIGAGIGASFPSLMRFAPTRIGIGAAGGALVGGEDHRMAGAVAGGALAVNPSGVARVVGDATRRLAPPLSRGLRNISEATGIRGAVNREMGGIQDILTPLGGRVGAGETAAPALLGARARQEAASAINYGTAAQEGDAALQAYRAHRGNIVSENVRRALNIIARDADDAAARMQGPAQTVQARPTLREAIESLRQKSAEAARRQPPRTSESPFVANRRAETAMQGTARPAVDRQIASEGPPSLINTTADFPPPQTPLPGMLDTPEAVHPLASRLYENPTIQRVANGLRRLDEFAGMEPDDPRFLDSMYKVFSDQKSALARRVENATGVQPVNLGRFTERDIRAAQRQILDVADEIMPTYRTAVQEHAQASAWMDAYRRGYSMVRTGSTAAKNLTQKTPAATEDWIARQQDRPELQSAAREGARAAMADVIGAAPLAEGRAGLLNRQPFTSSPIDASKRKAAMGAESDDFERMLAEVRRETAKRPANVYLPGTEGHIATAALTHLRRPALLRPAAQTLLGEVTRDPAAYQGILSQARKGETFLQVLERLTAAQGGGAAGRR